MNSQPAARWLVTSGQQDPATVERLLTQLPGWFGIPAANADYVRSAYELPTYLAWPAAGESTQPGPVGVLLARRHFPWAAEIHLMAVEPELHRHGVGRALVTALQDDLIADGCELLQVKTLGPSRADAGYARTRQFYLGMGFRPLEERSDLWGPENPCLILVKVLVQPARSASSGTALDRTISE